MSRVFADAVQSDFSRDVWGFFGIPFDLTSLPGTLDWIDETVARDKRRCLMTPNVNILTLSTLDDAFRRRLLSGDWCVIDGMPILWMTKFLGLPFTEKVSGSTVLEKLMESVDGPRLKVYVFGAGPGVAEAAVHKLNQANCRLEGVGWCYPGWGTAEELSKVEFLKDINAKDPDLLIVGLDARKGLEWIFRNRQHLNARVISCFGAGPAFAAGKIRRAPRWMQRAGLEWCFRTWEEPYLATRYLMDGLRLIRLIFTRLIPLRWLLARTDKISASGKSPQVEIERGEERVLMKFRGILSYRHRHELRTQVGGAVQECKNLDLDLGEVDFLDHSFLGTLLLAWKHLTASGKILRIVAWSPYARRFCLLNDMDRILSVDATLD